MDKEINIILDIQKPLNPQSAFRIFRGDNVKFNFTFKNGDNALDTTSAVKSQVFAKRIYADGVHKADLPIFSGEFTTITTATFTSLQTAGDAGNYLMAVILLDANNELITVQAVHLNVVENGYAGVYQPSPDFRDEVLDALAQAEAEAVKAANSATAAAGSATQASALRDEAEYFAGQATNAKTAAEQSKNAAASSATTANIMADAAEAEAVQAAAANTSATAAAQQAATSSQIAQQAAAQATEISDPEGWRTNTRAMIADLAASKTDVGTFHFGAAGGALQTSGNPMYGVLDQSVCMTFVLDEDMTTAEFSAGNVLNLFGDILYTTGYTGCGVQVPKTGLLQIRAGNGTGSGSTFSGAFYLDDIFGGSSHTTIPAGVHRMCFCWGVSAASSTVKIYRDANLVATATNSAVGADALVRAQNSKLGFFDNSNYKSTSFTSKCVYVGGLRSVAVFNFDMSAADAPYTPTDYATGKAIPVALQSSTASKRCILAGADYAIARNSTTKLVKDISGNGNDLTVYGDVVGDKDAAVAAFVDELKTQISQQSTNS